MYGYKIVEAALGRLHEVSDETIGSFRGRIKHFQRLGLVPSSPGKGQRIQYSFDDICVWAFGLELEEFGIDPTAIKVILDKNRDTVVSAISNTNTDDDAFLVTGPRFVSNKAWQGSPVGVRIVLASQLKFRPQGATRVMIINLTHVGRELRRAIEWCEANL